MATSVATFGRAEVGANRGKSPRPGMLLVGDTGFEPVTSSVSVIGITFTEIRAGTSLLVRDGLLSQRTLPNSRERLPVATHVATFRDPERRHPKIKQRLTAK